MSTTHLIPRTRPDGSTPRFEVLDRVSLRARIAILAPEEGANLAQRVESALAKEPNIRVVQDRCMMPEHRRLKSQGLLGD